VSLNPGSGTDAVNVGNFSHGVQDIQAPLAIDGPDGPTFTLTVDGSLNNGGTSATLDTFIPAGETLPFGRIAGLAPASITYELADTASPITINGGSGGNTFTILSTGAQTLNLSGGAGNNTLVGPNTANTWDITGHNRGTLGSASGGPVVFTKFQNLVGGSSTDTFFFHTGGSLSGSIDGQGGSNTLDYSGFSGDLNVNLPLGIATGVAGGIANIQNVTGSIGNDLIVGDANPNILIGGTGRNLIIGGAGGDTLGEVAANTGDNILIGGTTDYDQNLAALEAVFAEWTRTDLGFNDRASDLLNGTNGQGATPLNIVNGQLVLLNNATVHADNAADTLTGGGKGTSGTGTGRNWFFVDADDTITNLLKGKYGDKITQVH
jgi:hypothetical protein